MEEKIIEFKTAKLAKEKGFNLKCKNWYDQTETLNPCKGIRGAMCYTNEGYAPTQNFLKDWLRKFYNLDVEVIVYTKPHYCVSIVDNDSFVHNIENNNPFLEDGPLAFLTYEDAFEAGLLKALSLI